MPPWTAATPARHLAFRARTRVPGRYRASLSAPAAGRAGALGESADRVVACLSDGWRERSGTTGCSCFASVASVGPRRWGPATDSVRLSRQNICSASRQTQSWRMPSSCTGNRGSTAGASRPVLRRLQRVDVPVQGVGRAQRIVLHRWLTAAAGPGCHSLVRERSPHGAILAEVIVSLTSCARQHMLPPSSSQRAARVRLLEGRAGSRRGSGATRDDPGSAGPTRAAAPVSREVASAWRAAGWP